MLSSKILMIWLSVLYIEFATSAPTTNEHKTLIKTYDFPKTNVSFEQRSYDGAKLVYGICSGSDFEKSCKITQDILDGTDKSLACNITIKATKNDTKIYHQVRTAVLNKDRALVLSREGQTLKLTNLNFDGCKTSETSFLVNDDVDDARGINVIAYEDSYDVFYTNPEVCQNRTCRTTFDIDGKVVKKAAAWGPEFEHPLKYVDIISPVARHSSAKGFIAEIFEIYDKVYDVLATDDGEKVLVTSKQVDDIHAISTIGKNIGICTFSWMEDERPGEIVDTLECKQIDFEGKLVKTELRTNASTIIDAKHKIEYMARLNQPEGFVLFTIEYDHQNLDKKTYHAYRINENGERVKSIEIGDFQCASKEQLYAPRAFQNKAGQPCVSYVCDKKTWSYTGPFDRFTMGVRCFTDTEL